MESSKSRGRRSRHTIVASILGAAKRGLLKTQIMYKASLSFLQLEEYTKWLLDLNLLEHDKKKNIYTTTEKGGQYLDAYSTADRLLYPEEESTNLHLPNSH